MARRGKTVIKQGPDSGKMMQAEQSGQAARHRASEAARDQSNKNLDAAERSGQRAGATFERGQVRDEQAEQRGAEMDFQREVATSQAAMQQQRIDLQAADAGLEMGEGRPESPLLTDRQAALQAEMDQGAQETGAAPVDPEEQAGQQRQQEQMGRSLEGGSYITPTAERTQQTGAKQQAATMRAQNERMNSIARLRKAQGDFNKATFAKDKEARKTARETLQGPLRLSTESLDKVMNGEKPGSKEMKWLLEETKGHPIHDQIKDLDGLEDKGEVIGFLNNLIDKQNMDFMERTGETPDAEFVDWTSPKMQALSQNMAWVNTMAKSIGMGAYQGVKSKAEKNRIINKIASNFTKRGLVQPPPALGAMPEQGPEQPGQVMRQGRDEQGNPVTPPIAQRGLTSDEQLSAANVANQSPSVQRRTRADIEGSLPKLERPGPR